MTPGAERSRRRTLPALRWPEDDDGDHRAARRALRLWLIVAALVRVAQVALEPAALHPDALGQGLEPAFRAIYGFGDVAWEWREGLRSWLWPALLAPAFALGRLLGAPSEGIGMAPFVALARALPCAFDLLSLALACRLASRWASRAGAPWARQLAVHGVGIVAALHPAFAVPGAQTLIDVPAAAALLVVAWLASADRIDLRALAAAAAAAALLRVQLAPAVAIFAWSGLRAALGASSSPREAARQLAVGAALGALPFAALDVATWGAPFAPLFAYLRFNLDGGQAAFGVMPVDAYLRNGWDALGALLPWLAVGAAALDRRQPAALLALAAFVAAHQLLDYRVWRFLQPALWLALPMAAAATAAWLLPWLRPGVGERVSPLRGPMIAALIGATLVGAAALAWVDQGVWRTTWLWHQGGAAAVARSRALTRAALAISAAPRPTSIVQAVLPRAAAPGYAYFGHDSRVLHPLGGAIDRTALAQAEVYIVDARDVPRLGPGARRCDARYGAGVAVCRREPAAALPSAPADPPTGARPSAAQASSATPTKASTSTSP